MENLNRLLWVSLALLAFAANSVLCRYALGDRLIDPLSFTLVRLVSGAVTLGLVILLFQSQQQRRQHNLTRGGHFFYINLNDIKLSHHGLAAFYLLLYALCFSLAYISLDTATGALLLFASVQLCILGISRWQGHRLSNREALGCTLAIAGFLLLTLPHISTPSFEGFILMIIAGIAWGLYTLKGKSSTNATYDTTINFYLAALAMVPISLFMLSVSSINIDLQPSGTLAAIASGALASGLGYAVWYRVLPQITRTQAASSQLLVPVLAAFGGIIFLGESLSQLLIIASAIILGGIYLTIKR